MSTVVEIDLLARSRPGLDAPTEDIAAWYDQKSDLWGRVAAQTGDPQARAWAQQAHTHAQQLRAELGVGRDRT